MAVEDDAGQARARVTARYGELARAAAAGGQAVGWEPAGAGGCFGAAAYDDIAGLPEGAVRASLGCGNPVAVAALEPGETVLDLGSGGGTDVVLSARRVGLAGRVYGLERFSGSEIDLANLALRVAISEHVRFQSGGSVGLLVLDEVFGPLDEDRKARMLLALERLRGRFRQVLVVTHDASIKEQLPHALEVVKLPGRRATARMLVG